MADLGRVSIVVSHRAADAHRERIFDWTMRRYGLIASDAELVVGEMTSGDEAFCLAECRNNGAAQATRPYLLFADADAIAFRAQLECGLGALLAGAPWVLPYNNYHHLKRGVTEKILGSWGDRIAPIEAVEISASYPGSNSGLVMISQENFGRSGRFDERFKGWGAEDQAWASAVTTLVGPPLRLAYDGDLHHLWHPVNPDHTTGNPHFAASNQLWARYKAAAGDPDAMRQLVQEGA